MSTKLTIRGWRAWVGSRFHASSNGPPKSFDCSANQFFTSQRTEPFASNSARTSSRHMRRRGLLLVRNNEARRPRSDRRFSARYRCQGGCNRGDRGNDRCSELKRPPIVQSALMGIDQRSSSYRSGWSPQCSIIPRENCFGYARRNSLSLSNIEALDLRAVFTSMPTIRRSVACSSTRSTSAFSFLRQ